jgi:hypothetical protein
MRNRMMLMSVTLLVLGLCSGQLLAKGTNGFGLNVLVNDAPRPEYSHDGSVYVEAVRGASYSLRLTNPTPYRVAVALSVDGLNTIDAKHTDAYGASKWILEPYESTVISGWQVSDRAARSFFFTGERHSYGASLGQTQNLGVIEAVFFRERRHRVEIDRPGMPEERSNADGSAQPPTPAPAQAESGMARKSAVADDYAATGMGEKERHEIEMVNIDLEPNPIASVRIRYEFHPQLVKLGILPEQLSPLDRREHASGFSAYCPER